MKTFALLTLTLSLRALALGGSAPVEATATQREAVNTLINGQTLRDASVQSFVKSGIWVSKVTYDSSSNQRRLVVTGMMTVEGDIACGDVSLEINGKWMKSNDSFARPGNYQYAGRIVYEHMPDYCKTPLARLFNGATLVQGQSQGTELANTDSVARVLLDRQVFASAELKNYVDHVVHFDSIRSQLGQKKLSLEISGQDTFGSDISRGQLKLEIRGQAEKVEGAFGPQDSWKYALRIR